MHGVQVLDKVSPSSLVREHPSLTKNETKKDQERKLKIIAWLLPRFHKGLSDPKQYEKLIGKVEQWIWIYEHKKIKES